jgi:hypothetical protein
VIFSAPLIYRVRLLVRWLPPLLPPSAVPVRTLRWIYDLIHERAAFSKSIHRRNGKQGFMSMMAAAGDILSPFQL